MTTITIRDSRADGVAAAEREFDSYPIKPEHFTNKGWVGDHIPGWPHIDSNQRSLRDIAESAAPYPFSDEPPESHHHQAFIDGYITEAKRIAFERGWEVG